MISPLTTYRLVHLYEGPLFPYALKDFPSSSTLSVEPCPTLAGRRLRNWVETLVLEGPGCSRGRNDPPSRR